MVAKYVPPTTTVIGVDLLAIKPIRNVIMLKEDITTEKCRHLIRKNMKGKKVDVVLHDGAPSMGAAWAHDAYAQSGTVTCVSMRMCIRTRIHLSLVVVVVVDRVDVALVKVSDRDLESWRLVHHQGLSIRRLQLVVVCL